MVVLGSMFGVYLCFWQGKLSFSFISDGYCIESPSNYRYPSEYVSVLSRDLQIVYSFLVRRDLQLPFTSRERSVKS